MEASSSHSMAINYDVFLSFSGETRDTFIGYLYAALNDSGIMTFMDDRELLMGDNLSEELMKAIEESRLSIVVVSKNYASSKWCLRELAKIMDCMTDESRRIFPVFYHVDPSHVRHLSDTFGESFRTHEIEHSMEVQQWKDALKKLGHLTGEVVTDGRPEKLTVDKIKTQIIDMLRTRLETPDRCNSLVDVSLQLQQINVLLSLKSDEVCFVGIVGMGGIGKTTIAKALYKKMQPEFVKSCCFLPICKWDLVSLQGQLLSGLFGKADIKIWNEDYGAEIIKNRLSCRKVLIVLDGVKEETQLEKLAGSPNWFGPRSRVIITTRNRDILRQPNYKETMKEYIVDLLPYESAFSLFQKNAFGDDHPGENFMHLTKEIVQKIGGNPLALIQIGKTLKGRGIDIWKEKLKSLYVCNECLFDRLKISFDALRTESQQVFLDLTCFFNGTMKERVIEILESFGYSAHSEIQLLCERSLIEVREEKIFIHNLNQGMGQKIERDKQSRFWLRDDVLDAFDKQHGVKHIEGIVLDEKEREDKIELDGVLFTDMTLLRILKIGNVQLRGDITHLSKQLRLLNWHGYPLRCLPSRFESRHLFELLLPIGQTIQLWKGPKKFEKLRVIDARDSKYLKETPDFSKVPNLQRLVLRNCTRLNKIDPSVKSLNHLVLLDLRCCINLKNFSPTDMKSTSCKILTGSRSRRS